MHRRLRTMLAAVLVSVIATDAVYLVLMRLAHPELTETQLFLAHWPCAIVMYVALGLVWVV